MTDYVQRIAATLFLAAAEPLTRLATLVIDDIRDAGEPHPASYSVAYVLENWRRPITEGDLRDRKEAALACHRYLTDELGREFDLTQEEYELALRISKVESAFGAAAADLSLAADRFLDQTDPPVQSESETGTVADIKYFGETEEEEASEDD